MNKVSIKLVIVLLVIILTSCGKEKHQFPLEKRFWDVNDYKKVVLELNYGYEDDEQLPNYNDPNTKMIVQKLTDHNNYNVVLKDDALGLRHRNKVAEDFFSRWRDMTKIYNKLDRKDQYLYDEEMLAVWHFGLELQVQYFQLGNDIILESSDDPESFYTKQNINSNISSLIGNYSIYLDEINNEKAFTDTGKIKLAEGIDTYFTKLIELYPDADFNSLKKKAELLLKKSESKEVKHSLTNLIELIDSIKKASKK